MRPTEFNVTFRTGSLDIHEFATRACGVFGGADNKFLYVAARTTIYKVRVKKPEMH